MVPVSGERGRRTDDLAGSVRFFGVVGILIGAVASAGCQLLGALLPDLLTCALVVIALVGISGGLHMDGLSDTADGVFSSKGRDRMLEIMRDSRVGAMGVKAILYCFHPEGCRTIRFAAGDSMEDCTFDAGRRSVRVGNDVGAPAALSIVLLGVVGWFALACTGLYTVFASIVITLVLSAFFKMKLGGVTGDTLGGTCKVVETTAAISVSALVI